jgi:hypothetical protein
MYVIGIRFSRRVTTPACDIVPAMKKPIRKLAARSETIRALATVKLTRVLGGDPRDTGAVCLVAFDTGDKLAAVATATCG